MQKKKSTSALLFLLLLIACTKRVNTLVSYNFDQGKNQTDYVVFPYGSVALPGKWDKGRYNNVSTQQFFGNADSVEIAIAFNSLDGYEFNQDGRLKGWQFVEAFYKWETEYFEKSRGMSNSVLDQDQVKNYIVYRIFDKTGGTGVDNYFLVGEKNGNMSNFSIYKADKWTENQKVEFLKTLFLK